MFNATPYTYELQRRELLQLLKEEAQLQQQLEEQQRLLQRVSEASMNLFVWWRNGAAAAAAAAATSGVPLNNEHYSVHGAAADDAALEHPLKLFPGMLFYSLGELLQLSPALRVNYTAAPRTSARVGAPDENSTHLQRNSNSSTLKQSNTDLSQSDPSYSTTPWTFLSTATQTAHVELPTPALLIRHRLLDPSPAALPPTHAMLLGSVTMNTFSNLLQWLHALTLECEEVLHKLRPNQEEEAQQEQQLLLTIPTDRVGSSIFEEELFDGSALSPVLCQGHLVNEQSMFSSQSSPCTLVTRPCDDGDLTEQTKPPQVAGKSTRDTAATEDSGDAWSSLSWPSLYASLARLLSFWYELTTPPPPQQQQHHQQSLTELQQGTLDSVAATPWEDCWAAWTADQRNRAQLRFLKATLCGMHATLQAVQEWSIYDEQRRAVCRYNTSSHGSGDNYGSLRFSPQRQKVEVRQLSSLSSPPGSSQLPCAESRRVSCEKRTSEKQDVAVAAVSSQQVYNLVRRCAAVSRLLTRWLPETPLR